MKKLNINVKQMHAGNIDCFYCHAIKKYLPVDQTIQQLKSRNCDLIGNE